MSTLAIILISTNDHAQFISPCLKTIQDTCIDIDLKIIFVDNDGFGLSSKVVAQWQKSLNIKLINQKTKKGFAENFNEALKYVDGSYVLLLNVDTLMTENTVMGGIQILKENSGIGALTVNLIGMDNKLQACARSFPLPHVLFWEQLGISRLLPKSKLFGKYRLYYSSKKKLTFVDWISGAFILARKEAIIDASGMDEEYFLFSEDTDFAMRLKKCGWKVAFSPGHHVFHHKDPIGKKRRYENFVLTHRNVLLFLKKHYSFSIFMRGRIVLFLGMIIRICLLPISLAKGKTYLVESIKSYFKVLKIIASGHLEYTLQK